MIKRCKNCKSRYRGKCLYKRDAAVRRSDRATFCCDHWVPKINKSAHMVVPRATKWRDIAFKALRFTIERHLHEHHGELTLAALWLAIYEDPETRFPGLKLNDVLEIAYKMRLELDNLSQPYMLLKYPIGDEIIRCTRSSSHLPETTGQDATNVLICQTL